MAKTLCVIPETYANAAPQKNENSEEPPYSLIGIIIFMMILITVIAIKKSRNKKKKEFSPTYQQANLQTQSEKEIASQTPSKSPIETNLDKEDEHNEINDNLAEGIRTEEENERLVKSEREQIKKEFLEEKIIRNEVNDRIKQVEENHIKEVNDRIKQVEEKHIKKFSEKGSIKKTILAALDYCEENDIGSKSKLRRLKMKYKKWDLENERDLQAARPDYELLLDWIKEFENE